MPSKSVYIFIVVCYFIQLVAIVPSTSKKQTVDKPESSAKSRKPRSTVPEGQSKSFDALRDFEKAIWETSLKPSMSEFTGQVDNVWDVDQGSDRLFLRELRFNFKKLVSTEDHYLIQPSSTVSKLVSIL